MLKNGVTLESDNFHKNAKIDMMSFELQGLVYLQSFQLRYRRIYWLLIFDCHVHFVVECTFMTFYSTRHYIVNYHIRMHISDSLNTNMVKATASNTLHYNVLVLGWECYLRGCLLLQFVVDPGVPQGRTWCTQSWWYLILMVFSIMWIGFNTVWNVGFLSDLWCGL